MGLKDRVARAEGGEPEDVPTCEVCGQSYAYMRTEIEDLDARGVFSHHRGAKPCEASEQARKEWGQATGRVNLIRIVYEDSLAKPSE
jgi:hypothetical protein